MIPSIKIFGLTPFAVRFPNALFSIITIFLSYLITDILFKNKKISLLSSLFLSISPWALPMSRIALEANLVVFIISLATYLFLKANKNKSMSLFVLSSIIFGLSLFTYHSAKIFTPLLLVLLIVNFKTYRSKKFIIPIVIFSLFCFFNIYQNKQIKINRTGDIAIFNPTDNWQHVSNSQFQMTQNDLPRMVTRVFYNKIIYIFETFSQSYFSYFSPQFLLTTGAGETTYGMIPGFGVLGIIPFFGLILSLIFLIQKRESKYFVHLIFLFITILIPPAISAIAKGQYSGNRVSLMMPFLQIISAYGLVKILNIIPNKFRFFYILSSTFIFTFFSCSFLVRYFYQGNQILAQGMLYGHQQANEIIKNIPADQIIYSRKLSEPQAYVAFFQQIDPKTTQADSVNWLEYESKNLLFLDQLGEYSLDKFIFREINIPSDSQLPNTLIVGRPEEFRDVKPHHIIYYPNSSKQETAIYIYHTNK
jgi:4-amino-4-deoxy-L-arabinose transferase-like glycosyltransferase